MRSNVASDGIEVEEMRRSRCVFSDEHMLVKAEMQMHGSAHAKVQIMTCYCTDHCMLVRMRTSIGIDSNTLMDEL